MIKLYKNIKKLRKENGWSQDELAGKMGYTDRSSIAKIESGTVDLSESKIMAFARIFGVNPSDLMGWNEDDDSTDILPTTIRNEAQEFIDLYSEAAPEIQQAVVTLLKSAKHDS